MAGLALPWFSLRAGLLIVFVLWRPLARRVALSALA